MRPHHKPRHPSPAFWQPDFSWWISANVAMSDEWQAIVGRRVKEDLDLRQELASAKTPEAIFGASPSPAGDCSAARSPANSPDRSPIIPIPRAGIAGPAGPTTTCPPGNILVNAATSITTRIASIAQGMRPSSQVHGDGAVTSITTCCLRSSSIKFGSPKSGTRLWKTSRCAVPADAASVTGRLKRP